MEQKDITEEISIEEVFEAYFECRKTKRYSKGALSFEVNYEENLVELYNELLTRTWKPGKSTCFIITSPVKREVFAAPFRDRIVHHVLINRLNCFFEKYFINDSYACRINKGTHAAIKKVEHLIRSETNNGKTEAYVLKLDIKGFFMSINKNLLYENLLKFVDFLVRTERLKRNPEFEKYLLKEIIFNNPCEGCIIKSPDSLWKDLPKDKSLFTAKEECGLPIGNLTSQVFANFYLSKLDHFIKHTLKIKNYVRYVDDFIVVHKSKNFLKACIDEIRLFLKDELFVTLHPKKIFLQSAAHGVPFLGTFIKAGYTVSSRRVKENFTKILQYWNFVSNRRKPFVEEKKLFRSSVNSYLGILCHYSTWKFRSKNLKLYVNKEMQKWCAVGVDCRKIKVH